MASLPAAPSNKTAAGATLRELLFRAAEFDFSSIIGFYQRGLKDTADENQSAFLKTAASFGLQLLQNEVEPGDRVVIACASPRSTLLGYLGSVLIGAIPAILSVRPAFDDAASVAARIERTRDMLGPGVHVVLEHKSGRAVLGSVGIDNALAIDCDSLVPTAMNHLPGFVRTDDVVHIQLTSGSTGVGKAVAVTNASLLANLNAISERCEYSRYGVFVGWLPLYHDMGLVAQALSPIVNDMDVYILSPFDFLADPMAWLRLISEKRGTVSASPTFGYELVTRRANDRELARLDLTSWKSACCGAEPISAAVANEFITRFTPAGLRASAFTPSYGLAEATLAVTMTRVADGFRTLRVDRSSLSHLGRVVRVEDSVKDSIEVVSLGTPVADLSVSLHDESGRPIESDLTCGEVVVAGRSVAAGWIRDDYSFEQFPDDGIRTGDVGFFDRGELFVVERIKNIIIRNGQNYSATLLEQTMAEITELSVERIVVLDLDLVGESDLVAVVEVDNQSTSELSALIGSQVDRFDPPLRRVLFVKRGVLPRTTSGKKQHMATREILNSDRAEMISVTDLAPAAVTWEGNGGAWVIGAADISIEREVLEIVANHVRARGIDVPVLANSNLHYDLDVDSLGLLELAMNVETQFDVSLSREVVASVKTVADLASAIQMARTSERSANAESLTELVKSVRSKVPQYYTTVDAVGPERKVSIDGRWLDDFASGCYLGLDEDLDVIEASALMTRQWGLQRGWTRAVASPRPVLELEQRIANLIDVPEVMIFGTVTLLHFGVLPLLAGEAGSIIIDTAAHKSMHEAAALARAKGTFVTSFAHGDADDLERKLQNLGNRATRIIVVDGVYSMSGRTVDLAEYQALAAKYDALVYVDDAHGFGMLGENPTSEMPYGLRGNGVVEHLGCSYERIVYVGGLTKSYSAMLAFIACPTQDLKDLFRLASTMIFVHAPPTSTLAQAHAALDVNESRGDEIRARVYQLSRRLIDEAKDLGFEVKTSAFPIVNVILGDLDAVINGAQIAWRHGLLITPAVFPAAPLSRGGLRFTVTATNTEAQIEAVILALREISSTRVDASRIDAVREGVVTAPGPVVSMVTAVVA